MDGFRLSLGRSFVPALIVFSSSAAFGWNCHSITGTQALDRGLSSLGNKRLKSTGTQLWSSAPNNPFSSIIGDFAASIVGKGDSVKANNQLDSSLNTIMASAESEGSSWNDIRSLLESQQTEEERIFRDNLVKGYGVGSPMHKVKNRHYNVLTRKSVEVQS